MKIEQTKEDLTKTLNKDEEQFLAGQIPLKYDELEDARLEQLSDLKVVRESIYTNQIPEINGWNTKIKLPDIYELAQTLKSHISENLYSHPDAMFDVSGTSFETQVLANYQKAMLVHTFEQMKFETELEKIIESIVEAGESSIFVGWETKIKTIRRPQTIEERLENPSSDGFVIENKLVYDNAKVKHIKPEDFVFDKERQDNWNSCAKIYRTYSDLEDLTSNKANNMLSAEKTEILKGVVANKRKKENDLSVNDGRLEVLEYWGDIELRNGEILKNWLVVVAGRKEIIRFEPNPFIINPFIHANIIENPHTGRGISPLRVAMILNNISSTILNKQVDALALIMNPPYLAPKGSFKGEQVVKPGKIIEYDASLMPTAPTPLSFEKALHGWDFLNYFKSTIESATGIFKNMSGNIQSEKRTATELNYTASGQSARLNMLLDSINRKIIIPMVEKTAEIISNFKLGSEFINVNENGKMEFIQIDDKVRTADYIYRYGDRRASIERKLRSKELFDVINTFAKVPDMVQKINWVECFKFALEQYGIENANNFLLQQPENSQQNK